MARTHRLLVTGEVARFLRPGVMVEIDVILTNLKGTVRIQAKSTIWLRGAGREAILLMLVEKVIRAGGLSLGSSRLAVGTVTNGCRGEGSQVGNEVPWFSYCSSSIH